MLIFLLRNSHKLTDPPPSDEAYVFWAGKMPEGLRLLLGRLSRTYCPLVQDDDFPDKVRMLQSHDLKEVDGIGTPTDALQRALFQAIGRQSLSGYFQSEPSVPPSTVHVKDVSACCKAHG